jgi:hypothetical protein
VRIDVPLDTLERMMIADLPTPPPCTAEMLELTLDGRDGDFNGMSHAGTWLVVRNTGRTACVMPGLPTVVFRDAQGHELPARRNVPPGMRPGPFVKPVRLEPGASARTSLRWVSGNVFDHSVTIEPATVELRFSTHAIRAPFKGRLAGEQGKPVGFDQPPMEPSPR